jgi:ribosomal protein L12E/L44/L45/RPP1/RPP2
MQNNGTFLKSSFNLNGTFIQMLHFQPSFTRKPMSFRYEISGTDGLIHEGELKINESNSNKQIITFECKLDETYFCKVIGYFNESKTANQTIRLFYKVENDMDDIIMKSNSQKFGFRKADDDNHENDSDLPEEEEEDEEEEDEEEDEEEEDDEDMTLEMRVEQLKRFSNFFSDKE